MKRYEQLKKFAETRRARKLGNNTYLVVRDDGGYGVKLHDVEVVIHYPDRVVLDSGGWQTRTTKDRMNEYSPVHVWQDKGVWYVTVPHDGSDEFTNGHGTGNATFGFKDKMTVYNKLGNFMVVGFTPSGEARNSIKLRKQINKYAKDYADAVLDGKVTRPSGGDCWYCLLTDNNGKGMGGETHIKSHIKEKYYVPSILVREENRLSSFTKGILNEIWKGGLVLDKDSWGAGIAHQQIKQAVRHFCLHDVGLPA